MIQILRFPPLIVSMLTLISRWIPMSAHESIELSIQHFYLVFPRFSGHTEELEV